MACSIKTKFNEINYFKPVLTRKRAPLHFAHSYPCGDRSLGFKRLFLVRQWSSFIRFEDGAREWPIEKIQAIFLGKKVKIDVNKNTAEFSVGFILSEIGNVK